ncbi:glycosyltransferase family 2 protein [Providencia rettgeri]|uniref:glycosyltransferase family 2 protein n=1 Tax=Providencia rettgeri TaxID=587 RepID=UPI0034E0DB59
MNNKVSVVMPCFNSEATISRAINSVLSQSHSNLELIICDDSSTDSTKSIIKSFTDERIKLINNKYNKGAAGARNSCLDCSSGKYIAFLDSDDYWGDTKLSNQLSFMEKHNSFFTYGNYFIVNNSLVTGRFEANNKIYYHDLIKKCDIGCLTVMIKHELLGNYRFPENYKEDYRLWLTLLAKDKKLCALNYNGTDSFYNCDTNSLSGNKRKELLRQWLVINEQPIRLSKKIYCITYYVFNGIYKHIIQYRSGVKSCEK